MVRYVFLLLASQFVFAQNVKSSKLKAQEILQTVQKKYENAADYDYKLLFSMYKSSSPKIQKEYSGRVVKQKGSLYYLAAGTETISTGEFYARVSHEQKILEYDGTSRGFQDLSPLSLKGFMAYFKNATVSDTGSQWICTLSVGKFTALPYHTIELHINKDFTLSKQVLHFLKKIPFTAKKGKEELDYPKLVITMIPTIPVKNDKLFNRQSYVAFSKDGIKAAPGLKNYKVIDLSKK